MLFSVSNMCFSLYNVVFPQPLDVRQIQEKTSKQGVLASFLGLLEQKMYPFLSLSEGRHSWRSSFCYVVCHCVSAF